MPIKPKSHYELQRQEHRRHKKQDPFYCSKRWRETRQEYLSQFPLCAECLTRGVVTAANTVHHTTERLQLAESEWCNFAYLQALCASCHSSLSDRPFGKDNAL